MILYILVAFLWICVLLLYYQVLYLTRTLNRRENRSLWGTVLKRTGEHGNEEMNRPSITREGYDAFLDDLEDRAERHEKMDGETIAEIVKLLNGKQWIILTETENKRERDVMTNIKKLDDRRQLLANVDATWDVIGNEKRKV